VKGMAAFHPSRISRKETMKDTNKNWAVPHLNFKECVNAGFWDKEFLGAEVTFFSDKNHFPHRSNWQFGNELPEKHSIIFTSFAFVIPCSLPILRGLYFSLTIGSKNFMQAVPLFYYIDHDYQSPDFKMVSLPLTVPLKLFGGLGFYPKLFNRKAMEIYPKGLEVEMFFTGIYERPMV
jgi:hypothetical protein